MTPHEPPSPPPNLSISIRPGTLADLSDVLAIQLAAPEAPHWNQREYARIVEQQDNITPALRRLLLVATPTPDIPTSSPQPPLGFIVCSVLAGSPDTATIENLAVSPSARRQGTARALLGEALAWAVQNRASGVDLEVRASNFPAVQLYERCGFKVIGRRKAYYRQPVEDAVLMRSSL